MKRKTKVALGISAILGSVAAGIAINKKINALVDENLHRDGIAVIKRKVMSQKNIEDFESNPEVILGRLFYSTAPQINVSIPNSEGRHIND